MLFRLPNEESLYSDHLSQKNSTNQNSNQNTNQNNNYQITGASFKRHLKMNSENQKIFQTSLSNLALTKNYEEFRESLENKKLLKNVRSSTMPPHLINLKDGVQKSPKCKKKEHRRRLFSEKSNDLETTMFLIHQKNSRNLNKRFKNSVYSLQEALKFHMAVDKANSSTLTISKVGAISTPPVSITPSVTIEYTPSIKSIVSSNVSSQSLTLIETSSNIFNKTNLLTPIADLDQPIFIKSISNTDIESNVASSFVESDDSIKQTSFEIIPRNNLQSNQSESNINEYQATSRFSTYLVKDNTQK